MTGDEGKWQGRPLNEPNGLISRREYETYVAAQEDLQQLRDREHETNARHGDESFRRIDKQFERLEDTLRASATVLAKGTEDARSALAKGVDDARSEVERQIKDLAAHVAAVREEGSAARRESEKRIADMREELAKDTSRRLALTAAFSFVLAAIPVIILISRGTS